MHSLSTIIREMDRIAPPAMALKDDPVGLQAGGVNQAIRGILLAVDVLPAVVEEAASRGADLLITHHPALFHGLYTLRDDHGKGALAGMILRQNLAVFSAHTNLDIAPGGVADCLADQVGMATDRSPLEVTGSTPYLELTVFVPKSHLEPVRRAICQAGAGRYGNYSDCTFQLQGTGTFWGDKTSSPFIGKAGQLEKTEEIRLETRVLASDQEKVTASLMASHPYEVPAYEYMKLEENEPHGLGRIGPLLEAITVEALAGRLANKLKAPGVQWCGARKKLLRRVAVVSGRGAPVRLAAAGGADALITGECSYHDAEESEFYGIPIICLGHGASERVVLPPLAKQLRKTLLGLPVMISTHRATPFFNIPPA